MTGKRTLFTQLGHRFRSAVPHFGRYALVLTIVVLLLAAAKTSPAGAWEEYRSDGLSSVRVQGDILDLRRKLFEWEVRGAPIEGCFRISKQAVRDLNAVEGRAEIKVSALKGFKDGVAIGTKMDAVVWEKLRLDLHPTIAFILRSLDLEADPTNTPVRVRCVAQGDLAIAGITNAVSIPVAMLFGEGDRLTVSGEFSVRMSDFSIEPPRSGITNLRATDRVWISFEWRLIRGHASSAMRRRRKGHNYARKPRSRSFLCKRGRVRLGLAAFHG